jgi:hypothetical protein
LFFNCFLLVKIIDPFDAAKGVVSPTTGLLEERPAREY